MQRIFNHWWCTHHGEIYVGEITSWDMGHRQHLHPVFVDVQERGGSDE